MTKRKNKQQNRHSASHTQEKILPQAFFRKIGVTPFIDPNDQLLYRVVKKRAGKELADKFYDFAHNQKDHYSAMNLSFSDLELAKLWYGNNLIEACKIAEELDTLSVSAGANILDIGGGPGVLAFWMSHIWKDCHVTVADKFSEVGTKWAMEIGFDRVKFIDALLPDLKNIPDHAYDVVVMSRVLRYVDGVDMPRFLNTHNVADYPESEDGLGFSLRFGDLIAKIKRVLAPNGHLVIIDGWNPSSVYLTCKAMEQSGLFLDSEFFRYERVSRELSAIAFSDSIKMPDPSLDLSMGMSASPSFPQIPIPFMETLAESVRKLFGDTKPIMEFEYAPNKDKIKWKHEILEKHGLALIYITNGFCDRRALLYPAIAIPKLLKSYDEAMNNDASPVESSDQHM